MICGCDSWVEIEEFGKAKKEWLKGYLELSDGIPSHDTFGRVFSLIKPEEFKACFLGWVQEVSRKTEGEIIAIDGKTIRGSQDRINGKKAIHMVSAWAVENQLVLGQQAVDAKSNEITAIPELLKILEIKNCIVTIDAMGCQKEIAEKIVESGADYVLAIKGNKGQFYDDVTRYFEPIKAMKKDDEKEGYDHYETLEKDHGRIEKRSYWAFSNIAWLAKKYPYKKLSSIGMVKSERTLNGVTSIEFRYYISSTASGAKELARAIRSHWGIENQLHWVLDVVFREDYSRVRKDNAPQNLASLRHIALNLIKQETSGKKKSIQVKRKSCGWDNAYLAKVLWGI
jgi:predicted transposase YbfD/YdcC